MLKLPNQPETMTCYHRSCFSEDGGKSWMVMPSVFTLLHPDSSTSSVQGLGYQRISEQIDKLKSLLSIYYARCQMEIVFDHYSVPPDVENEKTGGFKIHDSLLIFAIKNDLFRQQYQVVIPASEAVGFINNQKIHEHYLFLVFEQMNQGIESDNQWLNFNQKEALKNKLTEELINTEEEHVEPQQEYSNSSVKLKI